MILTLKCQLKGHTYLNLQLLATGLFKYVWTFIGHQVLKGYTSITYTYSYIFHIASSM